VPPRTRPDHVTLKLAHPLDAHHAARLGLKAEDHPVGADITLDRETARAVIQAGYAQVDPEDSGAVADALRLTPPVPPQT
jgi:hypothetical protein